MTSHRHAVTNRILVVDDDSLIVDEYLHCLGSGFDYDLASTTLTDLEKVLFGDESGDSDSPGFEVQSCNQGAAAVECVQRAIALDEPFSIVFLDVRMPPGIDGIEAGKQIRQIDPNVNIVIVTGSMTPQRQNLGADIPPADRVFFFKKPFHSIECRQLAAALCGKWHADLALRHANDILEQRVSERTEALQRLAYYDPVTTLPNCLKLVDELQSLIHQAERSSREAAAIVLDIERFSFLNETLGYEAGTELLRAIGGRLVRYGESLAADRTCVVGRFGADEFACLIAGVDNKSQLDGYAADIKQRIEEPFRIQGREVYLKVSVGVAWHPVHGRDASTVFRCAESALHRSKRKPHSRITFYHEEMQHKAQHRFVMEAELRHAIEAGEILTWFQPQLCLDSGRICGVEALARWVRPDGTVVPPADFVSLSEDIGISDLLFESVMRHVCGAVSRWCDHEMRQVPVSVNLSAHQLRNRNLAGQVCALLQEQQVAQHLINLELTETALLEDLSSVRPILADLANFGVGIHIDDFGTGYSSLSYLAELPVHTLKIDQTFVRRLTESESNARVVQAIVALGKALDLQVIAEGVETEQQLKLVKQFGCDLAQGYLIAKPMPEKELLAWRLSVDQTAYGPLLLPGMFSRSA